MGSAMDRLQSSNPGTFSTGPNQTGATRNTTKTAAEIANDKRRAALTAAKKKAAAEAQKPKPKPAPKPVAKPAPKPAPKPKTAPKPVATYTPDGTEQTAKPKLTSTVKKAPSKASLRARKVLARKKKAAAKRLAAAAKRTANKAAQRARRDLRKKKKSPKYNSDGTVPKSVTQTAEGRNTPQGRRLARLEKRRERRTGVKRLYKK